MKTKPNFDNYLLFCFKSLLISVEQKSKQQKQRQNNHETKNLIRKMINDSFLDKQNKKKNLKWNEIQTDLKDKMETEKKFQMVPIVFGPSLHGYFGEKFLKLLNNNKTNKSDLKFMIVFFLFQSLFVCLFVFFHCFINLEWITCTYERRRKFDAEFELQIFSKNQKIETRTRMEESISSGVYTLIFFSTMKFSFFFLILVAENKFTTRKINNINK